MYKNPGNQNRWTNEMDGGKKNWLTERHGNAVFHLAMETPRIMEFLYIYIPISNREFRLLWLPGGYEVWYLSPMHWWNHATYSTGSQVLLALPGQALHSTEKGREVPIISFNHVGCNTFWTACLQMCVWHLIFAVRTKQFAPTLRALTRYCVDAGPRNELRWAKRSEL